MTCDQCKKHPGMFRVTVGGLLSAWSDKPPMAVKVVCLVCLQAGVVFDVDPAAWRPVS